MKEDIIVKLSNDAIFSLQLLQEKPNHGTYESYRNILQQVSRYLLHEGGEVADNETLYILRVIDRLLIDLTRISGRAQSHDIVDADDSTIVRRYKLVEVERPLMLGCEDDNKPYAVQ